MTHFYNCEKKSFYCLEKSIRIHSSILLHFQPGVNFINILHSLFRQYPFAKKSQSQTVIREKLH